MLKIGAEEIEAAARVIRSGQLFRYGDPKAGHPNECAKFERELARKMGAEHALLVTSGTAALICALVGMEIGPGDEVIVPGYTFISTALAPLALGALPVIAEIDESLTLDPRDAEARITRRTKAIIPVHMCGLPAKLGAIMRLAKRHDLKVLEDACQAFGGFYRGKRLGSIGQVGAYSFNYFKNITCGEGGAVVTNHLATYGRALIHHDGGCGFWPHGKRLAVPYFAGSNFRASELQGAILRVQLRRVDGLLRRTRSHKRRFMKALEGHPKLRFIEHNDLAGDCGTTVGFRFADERQSRRFISELANLGVGASTPIDSGRHVYSNWEPVMERRGSYHPALDAFRRVENRASKMEYAPDMCPRTLELLRRAVFLGIGPDWRVGEVNRHLHACEQAAESMGCS